MSRPGEIKEEFESFLQKIEGEKLAQQEKENKLSEDFIKLVEVRTLLFSAKILNSAVIVYCVPNSDIYNVSVM